MRPKCPKCNSTKLHDIGILCHTHPRLVMCACGWKRRVSRVAIIRLAVGEEYSRGYAAGHEDVMRARIRDAMEARRG